MEKKVYDLQINENLAGVMPPLQETELMLLTKSLISEGCRDPLVVWDDVIVDGHNRYRICRENGIPFSYTEMSFPDEATARLWIIRNQLARRNVPDYVRCEMVLPLEEELKAEAKKRQGQRNDIKTNIPEILPECSKGGETREELGKLAGVSGKTIDKAKKLAAEADEETKGKLRSGDITINKAYTALKERDQSKLPPPPEKHSGDLIPGYGVAQIMGGQKDYTRPSDSVYDIDPIEVIGVMPADDPVLRGNTELAQAKAEMRTCMEYCVRKAGETLHNMTAASVNEENMELLKEIVRTGFDQIITQINKKLEDTQNA